MVGSVAMRADPAVAGAVRIPNLVDRSKTVFADDPEYVLQGALAISYVSVIIGFCFSIAGFVISLLPQKAWRTRYKPRWPGFLLLAFGLYLLISGVVGIWEVRQEVHRRRLHTSGLLRTWTVIECVTGAGEALMYITLGRDQTPCGCRAQEAVTRT